MRLIQAIIAYLCKGNSKVGNTDSVHEVPESTPSLALWQTNEEIVPSSVLRSDDSYSLEKVILVRHSRSSHFMRDYPGLLVKYTCDNSAVHPGLLEYEILRSLARSMVTPKVFYISPFMTVENISHRGKLATNCRKCQLSGSPPRVGFIITERFIGPSIFDIQHGVVPRTMSLVEIFKRGIQMVDIIQSVHAERIVHGSIDWFHFVCRSDDCTDLAIVGFDHAKIVNDVRKCSNEVHTSFELEASLSPWEMRKCETSFRDDMYRIMLTVSFMIHGMDYSHFLQLLTGVYLQEPIVAEYLLANFVNVKDAGRIFEVDSALVESVGPLFEIYFPEIDLVKLSLDSKISDRLVRTIVRGKLAEITHMVVHTDTAGMPEYANIRRLLRDIVQVLESSTTYF
jgi:hypothetical protein